MNQKKNSIILGLSASKELAKKVSEESGIEIGTVEVKKFKDGETYIDIKESVRGKNIFVFQSTCFPSNDNLMELFFVIDALKRSSAKEINLIIPYFGYARQDRRTGNRTSISAKVISKILESIGATRVITFDLHSSQIEGFFDIPVDDIWTTRFIVKTIKKEIEKKRDDYVIVSPDYGGISRARTFSSKLGVPLAIVDKRREIHNKVIVENVLGNVEGKKVVIIDDIIDTGGTIKEAISILKKNKCKEIYIAITHPVFYRYKKENIEEFSKLGVKRILHANTIEKSFESDLLYEIDLSVPLSNIIKHLLNNESLSLYFYKKYEK